MSNGRKLLVGIAALALIAGGVIWALTSGGQGQKSSSVSGGDDGRVRIEIRAMPVMNLYRNGKELGTTPFSLIVPTSKTPFEMEARWTEKRMNVSGASKEFRLRKVFKVVPDRAQTIDLNPKDAEPITEE
jgi:hypothetical protein